MAFLKNSRNTVARRNNVLNSLSVLLTILLADNVKVLVTAAAGGKLIKMCLLNRTFLLNKSMNSTRQNITSLVVLLCVLQLQLVHYSNVVSRSDRRSFVRAILNNVIRNGKAVSGEGGGKIKRVEVSVI